MILQRLKHATREDHQQVERTVDLGARLRSREAYGAVLARFYGFYAPLEAALAAVDGLALALADLGARSKAGLLARDLATLGVAADQLGALPRCGALPALPDVAHAFGCMYVLEGATLGGQLIARQLGGLGVTPEAGGAFYTSYGPAVGPMWRSFGASLTAYATTPEREEAMVSTARATFAALEGWLAGGWQ